MRRTGVARGVGDLGSRDGCLAGPGGDVYGRGRWGSVLERAATCGRKAREAGQRLQVGEVVPRGGACDKGSRGKGHGFHIAGARIESRREENPDAFLPIFKFPFPGRRPGYPTAVQGRLVRVQFAEFTLDTEARQLFERSREVHLSPKAFELLRILVEERPRAISKQELLDRVWPGTFVSDASLARSVSELRTALNDHSRSAGFIQTVHGFGYRFVEARAAANAMAATFVDDELVCWLVNQSYEFQIAEGEHVIGRDPGAGIRLDSPRVSRTHARLVRRGRDASIEDLGSKNGTFVGGARISEATPLHDGDEVQIGPITFRFRIVDAPAKAPTEAWRQE